MLYFLLYFLVPIAILLICFCSADLKAWRAISKHLNEFVFDHTNETFNATLMKLYDNDGHIILNLIMKNNSKECFAYTDDQIVASSANVFYSHKVYNALYNMLPEDKRPVSYSVRKKNLTDYLNNM